jgi:hypothetical protein
LELIVETVQCDSHNSITNIFETIGSVPPTSSRWYINLQNGPGSLPGDIAFHFNPRYDAGAPFVVRNNRSGGGWGTEERDVACPINKGQNFEILILIEAQEFKVLY